MSLHPHAPERVLEETARIARAAFPQSNLYTRIREAFDTIYHDEDFSTLFPERGRPAESPWRLALISVFHFVEALSDRQAADAVRSRIDGKFALSLELTDPGFNHTVLSEFRSRLVQGAAETLVLDLLVLQERGLLNARGRQRTDSTPVLAAVVR
ncbi:MAG: transposase [Ktedonobacterales bacterium]|nr:transposase [Ktedonobacterales bacterium]